MPAGRERAEIIVKTKLSEIVLMLKEANYQTDDIVNIIEEATDEILNNLVAE